MNLGTLLGGAAVGYLGGKKAQDKADKKTVNPGSDVTDKARMAQNAAMSGSETSMDENSYYADGGMIGPMPGAGGLPGRGNSNHECTYDSSGRQMGKKR